MTKEGEDEDALEKGCREMEIGSKDRAAEAAVIVIGGVMEENEQEM